MPVTQIHSFRESVPRLFGASSLDPLLPGDVFLAGKKNVHLQGKVSLSLIWCPAAGQLSGTSSGREAGLTTSLRKTG